MIQYVVRRDGKITEFGENRIRRAIGGAVKDTLTKNPDETIDKIHSAVISEMNETEGRKLKIQEIESLIISTARKLGYEEVAHAYETYKNKRAKIRETLKVIGNGKRSTTDAALLIDSDSKETQEGWDRDKIQRQLEEEAGLSPELAKKRAKDVENYVYDLFERGVRRLNTTHIRSIVDIALLATGLSAQSKRQQLLGMPTKDLEAIIYSKSKENSNVSVHNPEAVNLEIAERVQKEFALNDIFDLEVAEAHRNGTIHVHDLGYPTRVYCSSHSLEYIKKYGLNKVMANLEAKSNPPNSAAVLNQHVQTFLASLQAHYAGALGFGFLNIFYSPLLKRPINVVKGKIDGKEVTIEKNDLEKLVEQGIMTLDKNDERKAVYFEKISERKELKELSKKEFDQLAQNLVFASSQNAFSRGGQTLFIDFNIHTGVPDYLKNVPAVGPNGKYMVMMPDGSAETVDEVPRFKNAESDDDPRNGDADDSKLVGKLKGGKIITYGYLEPTAQKFAYSLLEVWRKGDKDRRPFHFPKCDLHVDKNSFEDPNQLELIDHASHVAAENGSVYFMYDRGDDAVLAQCCRLKEKIEDKSMLKYPEKLRFCGFQNVTINLPQAAYKGKDLESTLREIDDAMELALKAHLQKKEFIQDLLEKDGTPMRSLGKPSDDGSPYIELEKATYIIGTIGLNEAVQTLTEKQLHEDETAYKTGLEITAHMYNKIKEFKERTGLKFTIEETPAESTTRRLAKIDLSRFKDAKKVVKGTEKGPYYSNSIHFAPDADIGLIDRIVGQSKFHDMIASGAIVHAYIGEHRPSEEAIKNIVKKAFEETSCAQLVFSPTYTECMCGNVMPGEKEICTNSGCSNSSPETVNKETLSPVTRIVGYNSSIKNWNESQKQIYEDRKNASALYAGGKGRNMSWLYNPSTSDKLTIIEFGKKDCPSCKVVKESVEREIKRLGIEDKVEFKINYLNEPDRKGLIEAAMYGAPLDAVPTLVIAGKEGYWKKTSKVGMKYDGNSSMPALIKRGTFIKTDDITNQLTQRIPEYLPK